MKENETASPRERATLDVSEAAQILGLETDYVYRLARRGDLPVIRLGGRILISKAIIERLLTEGNNG
jgi:excisionase family DNA binding protein